MKIKSILLATTISTLLFVSCDKIPNFSGNLNSEKDSISYSVGVSFGTHMANNNLTEVDYDIFIKGLEASISEDSLLIDNQQANAYIRDYLNRKKEEEGKINLEEGIKFLEENKNKEGVVTLPSGLQYRILVEGNGPSPSLTDKVKAHYRGTLIDGTEFDKSPENNPRSFGVDKVIPGWTEALQLMKVGSKWELFLPAELGYGTRVRPGGKIKANMVLIFEVELLEIEEPLPSSLIPPDAKGHVHDENCNH